MPPPLAPEPILRASLEVLYAAGVHTRNWTLTDEVSRRQLNHLWEALHDIPSLLTRWPGDERGLQLLRMYLAEADSMIAQLHLTARFDQVLLDARDA